MCEVFISSLQPAISSRTSKWNVLKTLKILPPRSPWRVSVRACVRVVTFFAFIWKTLGGCICWFSSLRLSSASSTCVCCDGLWEKASVFVWAWERDSESKSARLLARSLCLPLPLCLSLYLCNGLCGWEKEAVSRKTRWKKEMWDMEVLLVLRLCCNCTYGNNSAAVACLETWTVVFLYFYHHHHTFITVELFVRSLIDVGYQ